MKRILYVLTLWVCVSSITFAQTSDVRFNRDIRPILSEYCYKCHGFDKNARKGNLRLDTEEGAKEKRNSTAPFVSKSLEHSVAWQRITAKDPALRMPPASMGKTMKPKELAILKRWIEQGAKWEGHWAYQAVVRVNPPQIGGAYAQWSKNSADRFVLATLFKEGLTPSPQADKATLLRRLSLDLTGLPLNQKTFSRSSPTNAPTLMNGAWTHTLVLRTMVKEWRSSGSTLCATPTPWGITVTKT